MMQHFHLQKMVKWDGLAPYFWTALSMALTASMMVLLRIAHPPAAATTLIASLGFTPQLRHVPILMTGVAVLLTQAFLLNRLAGIPYPLWSSTEP